MHRKDDRAQASPFLFGDKGSVPGQEPASGSTQGASSAPGQTSAADTPNRLVPGAGDDASAPSLFAAPKQGTADPGEAYGYQKSLFGHKDEVSIYTEQMDARHSLNPRVRTIIILAVLAIVLLPVTVVLPKGIFVGGLDTATPARLFDSLAFNFEGFVNWIAGGPVTTGVSIVFWQTAAIAVAGAALALNGCVFQGALRNALAAPSTLGIMSGATLGTVVYQLVFGVPESVAEVTVIRASEIAEIYDSMNVIDYVFAVQGRALCSLAGCFVIVGLVLIMSHIAGGGKVTKVGLLIAGQVFSALIMGVIGVIRAYIMWFGTLEQQEALMYAVGGGAGGVSNPVSFLTLAIPLLVGMVVIGFMSQRLNLLAFDDDTARSMGLSTQLTRNVAIMICTALTGIVVSFVGNVGFVGFLVPHLARKMVGPNLRYLVPASAMLGAVYLLLANYLMNMTSWFMGSLGTLTSLIGAVFFLVMAIRERARGNAEWI